MKHVFVINPVSGAKCNEAEIRRALAEGGITDCEIHITQGRKDAMHFVNNWCNTHNEEVRFYACGGDGTINEVASGMIGHPEASLACYPCGSGNDFVKYYGGRENFLNIKELMEADDMPIDIMRVADHYSINVTNFGFDTKVCLAMEKYRHKPLIGGKNAYTAGLVNCFFTGMRTKVTVTADGERIHSDDILLCTVANSQYIGGSYLCAPYSSNHDGRLELCLVKPISRLKLLSLIGYYSKGTHLDSPKFKNVLIFRHVKKVHIEGESDFHITVDGETFPCTSVDIEIIPGAIRLALPKCAAGCEHILEGEPALCQ